MALKRLGSKSEAFHRQGHTWLRTTGLQSDVTIEIGEMSFNLHKFPQLSKSGLLEKLIEEISSENGSICALRLDDIPGGAKAFELISKFCYGVKLELTALNVVSLRCAAEYLRMTEEYGEGNLIAQTEAFFNEVFSNWEDSLKALETCEEVLPSAEELHIVSRCIDSLAMKACMDPKVFNLPLSGQTKSQNEGSVIVCNGISVATKPEPMGDNWWFPDVSFLNLPFYRRLIIAIESRGMKPETIAASLIHYAKKYLPLMNKQSSFNNINHVNPGTTASFSPEADQRIILEEIVTLLPINKGVTSTKFLLRLLRTAMKRVGAQLDQAVLVDLIPNMGYSVETLYDVDCFQRILDHFVSLHQEKALSTSPCIVVEGQVRDGDDVLTPITMVANLVDDLLAEVAADVNLKLPKFEVLAATIPDYARPLDDGVYHAIDVFLKAHPWLTDTEREQLCRLMNCQKLSIEASTHAAQNERLPLRAPGKLGIPKKDGSCPIDAAQDHDVNLDLRDRVSELEKDCSNMKEELQKLVNMKRKWKIFSKKFSFVQRLHPCNSKESCDLREPESATNGQPNHEKGYMAQ
ncbi:hypothetical protein MANES_09G068200v8 [Manihot esculenta]|uniref:Uncharacterized protein n=1 Tax=Manihot esculenta TaxID=3983 RepID=A0ACB7H3W5_MANES|nr:hypothetical protein MANES_09G068200v8 [Manihot esculenta]